MKHAGLITVCFVGLVACGGPDRDPSQFPITRAELRSKAAPSPAQPDDAAELTYRRYCVGCHGADGHGNGGTTGADLAGSDSPLTKSDEELTASIRDGKTGKVASMPAHRPVLSDAQIAAVLAYVRKQYGPSSP